MQIRIANIVENSVVDGEGVRTVLYTQGCHLACKGCQNQALWDAAGGRVVDVYDLAKHLVSLSQAHHNYTIQGGEPTNQPHALGLLMHLIKEFDPKAHIVVYTGHTWEDLIYTGAKFYLFLYADVVVDGPFIAEQDDPFIMWRGSRNQRPIDVRQTLIRGEVVKLDWDSPRLVIGSDGAISLPVGLVKDFEEIGEVEKSRRCGDWRS